jgi:hypothetical protein
MTMAMTGIRRLGCSTLNATALKTLHRRHCTVIGLATRGIMMMESCKVKEPTEK